MMENGFKENFKVLVHIHGKMVKVTMVSIKMDYEMVKELFIFHNKNILLDIGSMEKDRGSAS